EGRRRADGGVAFAGNGHLGCAPLAHHRHSIWRCFAESPRGRNRMVERKIAAQSALGRRIRLRGLLREKPLDLQGFFLFLGRSLSCLVGPGCTTGASRDFVRKPPQRPEPKPSSRRNRMVKPKLRPVRLASRKLRKAFAYDGASPHAAGRVSREPLALRE